MIRQLLLVAGMSVAATSASAFTVGYFDSSREEYGLSGFLAGARQSLIDSGYTLQGFSSVDTAGLANVDAFYMGPMRGSAGITNLEISVLDKFVRRQGGFLFIQSEWAPWTWTPSADAMMANWGIAATGIDQYGPDVFHTLGTSQWVSSPNSVSTFIGSAYSHLTLTPAGFEVLAEDRLGQAVLGVLDAGGGRSSDVLVSTDSDMWAANPYDPTTGWGNAANRALWQNIWQYAAEQTADGGNGGGGTVPEPGSLALMLGSLGILGVRRRCGSRFGR
jgi:hypothetical protein